MKVSHDRPSRSREDLQERRFVDRSLTYQSCKALRNLHTRSVLRCENCSRDRLGIGSFRSEISLIELSVNEGHIGGLVPTRSEVHLLSSLKFRICTNMCQVNGPPVTRWRSPFAVQYYPLVQIYIAPGFVIAGLLPLPPCCLASAGLGSAEASVFLNQKLAFSAGSSAAYIKHGISWKASSAATY